MEQEILKDWQKKVLTFVASSNKLGDFYLTGGTALSAFYLRHRVSDDLDFFSFNDVDSLTVRAAAKEVQDLIGALSVRFSRNYDRYQFFYQTGREELKVEFTKYPFKQLQAVQSFDGMRVDSEFDIAANKFLTVIDRFDPKDFVDLYFLLPKYPLENLREAVEQKFGMKVDPLSLGSELGKARNIVALPQMIQPLAVEELKDFFSRQAQTLRSDVIED